MAGEEKEPKQETELSFQEIVKNQNEDILGLREKLDAFLALAKELQSGRKGQGRCFYCNKPGHIKTDCWHWKAGQNKGKNDGKGEVREIMELS